jgi:hypothetical protein
MIINENDINIVPAILELVGDGCAMDAEFMTRFKNILALRGFEVESSAELDYCIDTFAETNLVEIYKGSNNKYMIRKK